MRRRRLLQRPCLCGRHTDGAARQRFTVIGEERADDVECVAPSVNEAVLRRLLRYIAAARAAQAHKRRSSAVRQPSSNANAGAMEDRLAFRARHGLRECLAAPHCGDLR